MQIGDAWSADRTERNLTRTRVRYRRSQLRRRALGGGLGATVVVAAAIWIAWPHGLTPMAAVPARAPSVAVGPSAAGGPMQFEDGSRIELLDAEARVVVDEVTPARIAVRLLAGRIRVDVVRKPERAFRVECGAVTVSVLGTAFELTRDGERTHVSVLRGRVAVDASDGSRQLSAGEAGWFPSTDAPQRTAAKGSALEPSWQRQAKRGHYKRAFELMPAAPEALADYVEALLLAADAARLSGHPAQALPYLRRVIERHPHDSRASLAAFTLGGVLLNQLDRPREADAAYARARSLALSPTLAQDALARQVEAAQRAGDKARMRELASEYLRRYPDGRRVQWVRDTSGL
jgi:transmembrane sensor